MPDKLSSIDSITFLGTAGARFMVSRQLAASGGMWMELGGAKILFDPGPGSIVQTTKRKLNAEKLDAIILSHRHLDHAADANVMIEAMTAGGHNRHGLLFAPGDALGDEPAVFSYVRRFVEKVVVMEPQTDYRIGGVSFTTSVRHAHPVETYGLVFRASGRVIGCLTDTRYFPELHRSYTGAELLIINITFTEPYSNIDHLAIPDVRKLIGEIKPRLAVLTHFGMMVWKARPWVIADELTQKTGVKVIAARDGLKLALSRLDEASHGN